MKKASARETRTEACKQRLKQRHELLVAEFGASTAKLGLETLNDAAVHLTDAAFAEIECGTNLFHRQLFVVVEDYDQSLVAIQTFRD